MGQRTSDEAGGKKKGQNVERVAEERTQAIKDGHKRDAKREREDYAVNLRKQKR